MGVALFLSVVSLVLTFGAMVYSSGGRRAQTANNNAQGGLIFMAFCAGALVTAILALVNSLVIALIVLVCGGFVLHVNRDSALKSGRRPH